MTDRYVRVPVAPLRERFLRECEAGNLTAKLVAVRMGWFWRRRNGDKEGGDSSRVLRTLGMKAHTNGKGRTTVRETVSYDVAVRLARALDMDPHEAGV